MSEAVELTRKMEQSDRVDGMPTPLVRSGRQGNVAVLCLSSPPVNTLTPGLRQSLLEAVEAAERDPEVGAIVLMAEGASFCTGFAVDKLTAQEPAPSLNTLCDRIEACPKPVIAALHGSTLEAGLALALAAHYRVIGRSARLGAPEITLGLVPTGGVTQRLPRLVGPGAAFEILLSGRPVPASQALELGLVDEMTPQNPGEAAIALAERVLTEGRGPRPTRGITRGLADGVTYMKEVAVRRARIKGARIGAPGRIVDCVEAALILPFEAGVARETVARADCFASEDTEALRHAHFAERRAARLEDVEGLHPAEVKELGLVGTGSLALGIAITALDHGIKVRLVGASADQLVVAEQRIAAVYTRAEQQGQITAELRQERLAGLTATTRTDSLSQADLVLEASAASTEARARLLARLEEFLPEETVLATVADRGFAQLARDLAHPERFLGLHFFAPSQVIRVVELALRDGVSKQALVTVHGFVKRLGKVPVTLHARDGLIANVVQEAVWAAVDVLLLMGVRPARIDRVMRDYGFPAGPCETMDALGLDHMSGAVAQFLAGEGRTGKEAGQGFYDYPKGLAPSDVTTEAILADLRAQGGVPELSLSDRDISERLLLAAANAGARLLQSGVVMRPVDIDVVMMLAKGYPRYHGGPMKAADLMGIFQAEKRLKSFSSAAPDIWEPAALWRELAKNGDNFENLNLL
jgi:3-hydroxyacyl-CoA dehydrogenase